MRRRLTATTMTDCTEAAVPKKTAAALHVGCMYSPCDAARPGRPLWPGHTLLQARCSIAPVRRIAVRIAQRSRITLNTSQAQRGSRGRPAPAEPGAALHAAPCQRSASPHRCGACGACIHRCGACAVSEALAAVSAAPPSIAAAPPGVTAPSVIAAAPAAVAAAAAAATLTAALAAVIPAACLRAAVP